MTLQISATFRKHVNGFPIVTTESLTLNRSDGTLNAGVVLPALGQALAHWDEDNVEIIVSFQSAGELSFWARASQFPGKPDSFKFGMRDKDLQRLPNEEEFVRVVAETVLKALDN